jgi:hypothetical protein
MLNIYIFLYKEKRLKHKCLLYMFHVAFALELKSALNNDEEKSEMKMEKDEKVNTVSAFYFCARELSGLCQVPWLHRIFSFLA